MRILIVGSGQVGLAVAQNPASSFANDVTIVDLDEKALYRVGSRLDVQTIVGNGASPFVLEQVGAADSNLLLALTHSNETNIIACKITADPFNIPSRIACVCSAEYSEYPHPSADGGEEADGLNIPDITETISPEQLIAEQFAGLFSYTNTLQVLRFSNDRAWMVVVQARQGGLLANKEVTQINEHLPEGADCQVCAVCRDNHLIVSSSKAVIIEGDEVFFVTSTNSINVIVRELRPNEQRTRRTMAADGGKIGHRLVRQLESEYDIKIIEYNSSRAEWLAENLDNTPVLQGAATDETLFDEEYINKADVLCTLTNDDENNVMSSLLAKSRDTKRTVTIVNRSSYVDLFKGNKIDIVVSSHLMTIGSIFVHIYRDDISAIYPPRRGTVEAIGVVVHGDKRTSSIVGCKMSDVKQSQGCHFIMLVYGDEVIMVHHGGTVLQDGGYIIFFVPHRRMLRKLEKLIQVKTGFFGQAAVFSDGLPTLFFNTSIGKMEAMLRSVLIASLIATATLPVVAELLNYNVTESPKSAGIKVPRDAMTVMSHVCVRGKERQAVNTAFTEKFSDFSRRTRKSVFKTELTGHNTMSRYQYNNGKRMQTGWEESARLKVGSKNFAVLSHLTAETQANAEVAQAYFSVSKQKCEETIDRVSKVALLRFEERTQVLTRTLGFSSYKIVKLNLGHVGGQVSERSIEAVMMRSKTIVMSMAVSNEGMDNVSPGSEKISITVDGSIQT